MTDPLHIGVLTLQRDSGLATWPSGQAQLTRQESAILQALCSDDGAVVSKESLLKTVWGDRAAGSRSRVLVALHRLKGKIGKGPDAPVRIAASGNGYRLLARGQEVKPAGIQFTGAQLQLESQSVLRDGEVLKLGKQETRLLSYLVGRANTYVPHADVISHLWGVGAGDKSVNLRMVVRRCRQKLEPNPKDPRHLLSHGSRGVGLFYTVAEAPVEVEAETLESPFVGRTEALLQLVETLRSGARCVTLLGPGGQGKTRLARQVMGRPEVSDLFSERVGFCDLVDCENGDDWVIRVAGALNIELMAGADLKGWVAQIGDVLAGRPRTLLVLDTMETAAEFASDILSQWVRRAGRCQFLVTSRVRLGLAAEQVLALEAMPLSDGMTLFLERARRVQPGLRLGTTERKRVAPLLARLEGNALAILLSAGQLGNTSFEAWAVEFEGRSGSGSVLEGTLQRSWDLLSATERHVLLQITAFRGGFTIEAAEEVVSTDEGWVDEWIERLLDHSLLFVRSGPQESQRYAPFESVRAFCESHMDGVTDPEGMRADYVAYYFALAERVVPEVRESGEQGRAYWSLDVANMWQALEWASGGVPIGWALCYVYNFDFVVSLQSRDWLGRSETVSRAEGCFSTVRMARRNLLIQRGDSDRAEREIYDDPDSDPWERVESELNLALLEERGGRDVSKTMALLERYLPEVPTHRVRMKVRLLGRYASALFLSGYRVGCLAPIREALALALTLQVLRHRLQMERQVGIYLLSSGHLDEAEEVLRRNLAAAKAMGVPRLGPFVNNGAQDTFLLRALGNLYLFRGDFGEASVYLEEATRLSEEAGHFAVLYANAFTYGFSLWFQGQDEAAGEVLNRFPVMERPHKYFKMLYPSLWAVFLLHRGEVQTALEIWQRAAPELAKQSTATAEDWTVLWQAHCAVAAGDAGWRERVAAVVKRPNLWLPRAPQPDPEGGHRGGHPFHWLHVLSLEEMGKRMASGH